MAIFQVSFVVVFLTKNYNNRSAPIRIHVHSVPSQPKVSFVPLFCMFVCVLCFFCGRVGGWWALIKSICNI